MWRTVPLLIAGLSAAGSVNPSKCRPLKNSLSEANDGAALMTDETRIESEEASQLLSDTGRTFEQKKKNSDSDRTLQQKKKGQGPNVLIITTDQHRFDALQFVQEEMLDYFGKTKVRNQC
jgi:hypothetical protein